MVDPITSDEELPPTVTNAQPSGGDAPSSATAIKNKTSNNKNNDNEEEEEDDGGPSLIIPITSSTNGNNYTTQSSSSNGKDGDNNTTTSSNSSGLFIEIFPEEMSSIRPNTLSNVLRDERAPLKTWCDASLLYMKSDKREKEGCDLLNAAVDSDDVMSGSNTSDRLRVLASAGIAALAQANRTITDGSSEVPTGLPLLDTLLESSKAAEKRDKD